MPQIQAKKSNKKAQQINLKFVIDCKNAVDEKVLILSDFSEFLQKRIKVEGKTGNLGTAVAVAAEGSRIVVTSTIPFSKRYLKYLTKKYLRKQTLRNYLYVTAKDKTTYELRFFSIQQDQAEE